MYKIYFRRILKSFFLLTVNCTLLTAQNELDVIVIDAGHGGKDPGTIGTTGVQEKNIVLPIAVKFGQLISQKYPDIKIIYTRDKDEFIEVKDRTVIANNSKGKLFISIHANHKKQEENEKNGFEIYVVNKERFPEAIQITEHDNTLLKFQKAGTDTTDNFIFSTLAQNGYFKYNEILSSNIEINMLSLTQLASRGVMQANFWVIMGASMPSVLIESGYLSDPNDEKYLNSAAGQAAIAAALFNAFSSYKNLFEMN
jgi:N-acetylmuramoyl-L-alanine amidase